MQSLHKNNNNGHVSFHGMEIVASVKSGVIVKTTPRLKLKDFQMIGKIKICFHNSKSAANNIKYDIFLKCPLKVSNNMEWYMQMVNCSSVYANDQSTCVYPTLYFVPELSIRYEATYIFIFDQPSCQRSQV